MTDVSTDTDALRSALAGVLSTWVIGVAYENSWTCADVLVDGSLRGLIAERDQAVAAVERVRELAADYEGYVTDRGRPAPGSYDHGLNMAQAAAALDIRRALDGTP